MGFLLYLFNLAVDIYIGIIIVQVIVSWLVAFDVIRPSSEQARNLINLLKRATDPVYKPLNKYIPPIGGVDITPLVVILGLTILRSLVIGALH